MAKFHGLVTSSVPSSENGRRPLPSSKPQEQTKQPNPKHPVFEASGLGSSRHLCKPGSSYLQLGIVHPIELLRQQPGLARATHLPLRSQASGRLHLRSPTHPVATIRSHRPDAPGFTDGQPIAFQSPPHPVAYPVAAHVRSLLPPGVRPPSSRSSTLRSPAPPSGRPIPSSGLAPGPNARSPVHRKKEQKRKREEGRRSYVAEPCAPSPRLTVTRHVSTLS